LQPLYMGRPRRAFPITKDENGLPEPTTAAASIAGTAAGCPHRRLSKKRLARTPWNRSYPKRTNWLLHGLVRSNWCLCPPGPSCAMRAQYRFQTLGFTETHAQLIIICRKIKARRQIEVRA